MNGAMLAIVVVKNTQVRRYTACLSAEKDMNESVRKEFDRAKVAGQSENMKCL